MFYEKLESEELRLQSFKIISNDMKLEPISWDLKFKNPFFEILRGRLGGRTSGADFLFRIYPMFDIHDTCCLHVLFLTCVTVHM